MMPTVTISQSNFSRLQKASTPLVDDLDSVLAKILDVYESKKGPAEQSDAEVAEDISIKTYPPDNPPKLTYTTINSVKIDGVEFGERWWNSILFEIIGRAAKKMGMPSLKPFLDVNYKQGKDDKFHYIGDAGISVQGRDSNLCWRSIMKVAKTAKIPVEVDFTWQDQPTAAFPGRIGRFVYDGK